MWSLEEWLALLDLEKYMDIFRTNNISSAKICCSLDDNFLIAIGVQSERDRCLILENLPIHAQSKEDNSNVSNPFFVCIHFRFIVYSI